MDTLAPGESITVIRNTTTGHGKHSATIPLAKDTQNGVAKDTEGRSIGPMPVQVFLDAFMPSREEEPLDIDTDFFEMVPETGPEVDRYQPFVSQLSLCHVGIHI